jgi:hypothetical protein
VQLELPGALSVPDGRYLARGDGGQRVLVVETLGAPPPPRRRRRRPKQIEPEPEASILPVARVTAVRAHEPFDSAAEAEQWLEQTIDAEEATDAAVADAVALLNRALHAQAVASADPLGSELRAARAVTVRVGHGSGKEVAAGRFSAAQEIDVRSAGGSRRQRQDEDLRPQERLAAILGGRERVDTCETLLLRTRADLDAGRLREAALQLRVTLEALLSELDGALADPDHEEDMGELRERRKQTGEAANAALHGELPLEDERNVEELAAICERILRRRRVLRG